MYVDSTTIHAGESATPVYLNYVASATTYANLEAVKAATANGKIIEIIDNDARPRRWRPSGRCCCRRHRR